MNDRRVFEGCNDQLICKPKRNVKIGEPLEFNKVDIKDSLSLYWPDSSTKKFSCVYAIDTRRYNGECPNTDTILRAVNILHNEIDSASKHMLKMKNGNGDNKNCVGGTYIVTVDKRCISFNCKRYNEDDNIYLHAYAY